MISDLFQKSREYLNYFFDRIDLESTQKILEILHKCPGLIFLTGVGKSEVMAQKIAVTMASTGTRALFISAINALHGDIGMVTDKDIVVMLSKTGETDELLNIVPYVRNKGAKLIAVVSSEKSRLARASDHHIVLPVAKELCPFNLVPTTSTQVQMIFGDVLVVALMELNKYTLEQYAKNHPGGKIGRRVSTKVGDLMIVDGAVPICRPEDKVIDTLVELSHKRCGCVLIVDQHRHLLGIFTDGDLGRALNKHGSKTLEKPIGDLMTEKPRTIGPDELAWKAMELMEADQKHPITVLAVVDQNKAVLGLIKMHDIVQAGI